MSEKPVGEPAGPVRIVRKLAQLHPDVSGTRLKRAVTEGQVLVDGVVVRDPGALVMQGSKVQWDVNKKIERNVRTSLTVLFEDDDAIAVMKPAGLLTHPTEAKEKETLLGRVSTYVARKHKERGYVSVVHRLDKETSGILVFARSRRGMVALQAQLRAHSMDRRYQAVVEGDMQPDAGIIDRDLVEDRGDRRRGVARPGETGIRAVTEWKVLERFGIATLIEAKLQTGRTHQIRVHMANAGHSLVGDPVYRNPNHPTFPIPFPRQALHAGRLGWTGPDGKVTVVEAPAPADFLKLLALLRARRPRTLVRPAIALPAGGSAAPRLAARSTGATPPIPSTPRGPAARPLVPTGSRPATARPATGRPTASRPSNTRSAGAPSSYKRPAGAPPPRTTSAPRPERFRAAPGKPPQGSRRPDPDRGPDFRKRTDAKPGAAERSDSRGGLASPGRPQKGFPRGPKRDPRRP